MPKKDLTAFAPAFVRGFNNYDGDAVSNAPENCITCDPELGEAQQQFRDDCDINEIVRRFGLTGTLPEDYKAPVSGDFTNITDFQTAMNAIRAAQESFMEMPAELRARFANDPQRLIQFVSDGTNRDEAIKLGLIPKPPEQPRPAPIDTAPKT